MQQAAQGAKAQHADLFARVPQSPLALRAAITNGIHNTWEPLIVCRGRERHPNTRDWLAAQPARRGDSDLLGRKPQAFAAWMFGLLGLLPGDQFDDLFLGVEVCRGTANDRKTTS
jgi:hypothetical protein